MNMSKMVQHINNIPLGGGFFLYDFESPDTHEVIIFRDLVMVVLKICRLIPLRITSGYRTPEHNRKIGGATNSYHKFGLAVDLSPESGLVRDLTSMFECAVEMQEIKGLGIYDSGIIHLDLRPAKKRIFWVKPRKSDYIYFKNPEECLDYWNQIQKQD